MRDLPETPPSDRDILAWLEYQMITAVEADHVSYPNLQIINALKQLVIQRQSNLG